MQFLKHTDTPQHQQRDCCLPKESLFLFHSLCLSSSPTISPWTLTPLLALPALLHRPHYTRILLSLSLHPSFSHLTGQLPHFTIYLPLLLLHSLHLSVAVLSIPLPSFTFFLSPATSAVSTPYLALYSDALPPLYFCSSSISIAASALHLDLDVAIPRTAHALASH